MIEKIKIVWGDIHLPTLLFCSGCLFPISYRFSEMSKMIVEKWAVAGILILFFLCIVSIFQRKPLISHPEKALKTFVLLGFIEIIIAFLQILGILTSFHPFFRFTGSFRNPAVFGMMMVLCLSICIFYTIKSTGKNRTLWYFLSISFFLCLSLSESRTCLIAGTCSSFFIIFAEIPGFRSRILNRKILLLISLGCILLLIALYYYKRNSANGRVLLWIVSLKMIAEKPLLGWGEHGFSSSYMPFQAKFLLEHPEIGISYLADNASHPFNEFLLFSVKYGLMGLTMLFGTMCFLIRMALKIKSPYSTLYLSNLLTLFILSMFSFPFTIPMIWLVSTFLLCSIISIYCIDFPKMHLPMILLLSICIFWIFFQNRYIYEEWQWHKLQVSSAPIKIVHQNYAYLYKKLCCNPSFLYNYGAWLHHNGYYKASLNILSECKEVYDDYNVELLIADNYRQLKETLRAIEKFEYANAMIPSRFLPLYYEMIIYEEEGDDINAYRIAQIVVNKPAKIEKSPSVRKIKDEAEMIMLRFQPQ